MTDAEITAKLEKPGAGIPFSARLFNRFFLKPFVVRKVSWKETEERFTTVNSKLLKVVQDTPEPELLVRALVPPQVGLEDSSRYWSMAMTLRHLTIVGQGMEQIIVSLSCHKKVNLVIDTGKVKPEEHRNVPAALYEYIEFSTGFLERIRENLQDRDSKLSHHHPWFGGLMAKDWMWLMGVHTGIHLKQIRNIQCAIQKSS